MTRKALPVDVDALLSEAAGTDDPHELIAQESKHLLKIAAYARRRAMSWFVAKGNAKKDPPMGVVKLLELHSKNVLAVVREQRERIALRVQLGTANLSQVRVDHSLRQDAEAMARLDKGKL